MSRLLDLTSRRLSARKESFYTIGSAGHEGNAVLAKSFVIPIWHSCIIAAVP